MEEKQWRILGGAYEGGSKRKKLLVPIIALMLCAVAVIGAGYAYQSSVTVENNKVAGGELSIDITGKGSAFLADTSVDIIFVQEKTYDKASSSSSVKITASGHDDEISKVMVNLGDGAKASLLGDASVKVSNKTGETATKITATVTASDFVVGDGKNLSDLIKEYVFVWQIGGNYSYTEVSSTNDWSSNVNVTIPTDPSDVVVGCTMYAVISDVVFNSGDVKTMVDNINTKSDIDVKFEVTTTAS